VRIKLLLLLLLLLLCGNKHPLCWQLDYATTGAISLAVVQTSVQVTIPRARFHLRLIELFLIFDFKLSPCSECCMLSSV